MNITHTFNYWLNDLSSHGLLDIINIDTSITNGIKRGLKNGDILVAKTVTEWQHLTTSVVDCK